MTLEAPATLALTSDPPEDLTILRIVGDFNVALTTTGVWILAVLVQDSTWTPSGVFATDADKRVLWSGIWQATGGVATEWLRGRMTQAGQEDTAQEIAMTHIDIAPKARIRPGQALYLVAYEISGAAALTTATANMRLLFQRSGRR